MDKFRNQFSNYVKSGTVFIFSKSYCPYCDRENIHVYYKNQHEKTKYCLSRRKVLPIESLKTVQLINQITD